eukprot:9613821-Alexandrium_andersonii.AAC.1
MEPRDRSRNTARRRPGTCTGSAARRCPGRRVRSSWGGLALEARTLDVVAQGLEGGRLIGVLDTRPEAAGQNDAPHAEAIAVEAADALLELGGAREAPLSQEADLE